MQVRANHRYCKGCNLCVAVCPSRVFEEGKDISDRGYVPPRIAHPERCPNFKRRTRKNAVCEMCILTCPDQALTWNEEGGSE
ncbi:MAG: 4Fe-4S dicluster domain-containing protein [Methanomassiliicoccales archaeon]|nr:4Fe-4S dicluster domain-containing protein [Methanomassiliicoccales archaeon]